MTPINLKRHASYRPKTLAQE